MVEFFGKIKLFLNITLFFLCLLKEKRKNTVINLFRTVFIIHYSVLFLYAQENAYRMK
jgi:hypothetical protein